MFRSSFFSLVISAFCLLCLQSFIYAQTPTLTPTPELTPQPTPEATPEVTVQPPPQSTPEAALPVTVNTPEPVEKKTGNIIHIGDLIDVDVVGSTEFDWRGNLTPEGFLNGVNFVEDPIYAQCRTEDEVAADIAKGFSKILKDPQVVVKIIDRSQRPVSLLYGAVRTPQRFRIQRPVRLNELLILSGGITERASGEIQILRSPGLSCQSTPVEKQATDGTEGKEVFIPAKQSKESQFINIKITDLIKGSDGANPVILSGDVVTVQEAEPIYVTGGVANPKQINAHSQLTLSRAISMAGGFTKDADPKNIMIFRRDKTGMKTIEVDFATVKASEEKDVVLKALDIVEIPQSGRARAKLPPILNIEENKAEKSINPPLRIID